MRFGRARLIYRFTSGFLTGPKALNNSANYVRYLKFSERYAGCVRVRKIRPDLIRYNLYQLVARHFYGFGSGFSMCHI
jgi:hypothetical protein